MNGSNHASDFPSQIGSHRKKSRDPTGTLKNGNPGVRPQSDGPRTDERSMSSEPAAKRARKIPLFDPRDFLHMKGSDDKPVCIEVGFLNAYPLVAVYVVRRKGHFKKGGLQYYLNPEDAVKFETTKTLAICHIGFMSQYNKGNDEETRDYIRSLLSDVLVCPKPGEKGMIEPSGDSYE